MASGHLAIGHQRLLLWLVAFGILYFVLVCTVFPVLFFLQPIIWIAGVIVVYLDAKEVNRAKGMERLVAAGGCLILFFRIFSLPCYLFGSRPEALSAPSLQNSTSQDVLEVIRKLGELKDTGVVTEDEFQRKKQELLSRGHENSENLIFNRCGQSQISAVDHKNGIIQCLPYHVLGMRPC